jgi:hypothetical protein
MLIEIITSKECRSRAIIGNTSARASFGTFFVAACLVTAIPMPLAARQVSHCAEAARFLEQRGMRIVTEPDTIDDWRTAKRQPGCKVTASGLTQTSVATEAVRLYEAVRASGWTRTPEPRDAPGESSLRFRKRDSDCLFNVYEGLLLMTEAERKVSAATVPGRGVLRYGVFVMCMAALPAAPRRMRDLRNRDLNE